MNNLFFRLVFNAVFCESFIQIPCLDKIPDYVVYKFCNGCIVFFDCDRVFHRAKMFWKNHDRIVEIAVENRSVDAESVNLAVFKGVFQRLIGRIGDAIYENAFPDCGIFYRACCH